MAFYKPIELVKSYSGKICSHSDTYFAKRYGTLYTGKICNPSTKPASQEQIAKRTKFTQARAAVAALTTEQKAAYKTAFDNQKKYRSLQGYMFAMEYAKIV